MRDEASSLEKRLSRVSDARVCETVRALVDDELTVGYSFGRRIKFTSHAMAQHINRLVPRSYILEAVKSYLDKSGMYTIRKAKINEAYELRYKKRILDRDLVIGVVYKDSGDEFILLTVYPLESVSGNHIFAYDDFAEGNSKRASACKELKKDKLIWSY